MASLTDHHRAFLASLIEPVMVLCEGHEIEEQRIRIACWRAGLIEFTSKGWVLSGRGKDVVRGN